MRSTRVHELAKELGVGNKEVISAAKDAGVLLKTSSNSLDADTAEKIRKRLSSKTPKPDTKPANEVKVFESGGEETTERRSSAGVTRRRKKKEKPSAQKPEEKPTPDSGTEPKPELPAHDAKTELAAGKKPAKSKSAETDPEKEKVAEQIKEALVRKLTSKKKEYVVDEKKFRRKQEIRRKKPPQNRQSSPLSPQPSPGSPPAGKKNVKIGETITLEDLARRMEVRLRDVRAKAKSIGLDASKSLLDYETAILIAAEYGMDVEVDRFDESVYLDEKEAGFGNEAPRPPVVSVMGHVDHGKTTLLDALRKSNVASGEAGGITQHIGAYRVASGDRRIVFIDTPGHEAFTSMRARGAKINDMAILVVAADDGVKEQTVEAINHAEAAGVPVIVAVNKIDKDGADPESVKRQLSERGLVPEEWGGNTLFTEISAKTGRGLKEFLDLILLQADILELKAPQTGLARGIVLESRIDKGRGAILDMIVTKGELKVGDNMVAGIFSGRVRGISDENGVKLKNAGPSMPVEVMGLSGAADAGENFYVVRNEKTARAIVENRKTEAGQSELRTLPGVPLPDAAKMMQVAEEETAKELFLIIKADTQGSVEAIKESVEKIETEKCSVKIVHSGVGGISGTDVELAHVTKALIFGFNVRPDAKAASDSSSMGILIETHSVVYEIVERIKQIMEGLLDPVIEEETLGRARVVDTFRMSGQTIIAGCKVEDGKVLRGGSIRVVRDGTVIYESKVGSLKRFKDDVREVLSGYECGLTIENFNDIKVGDVFEIYSLKETAQHL